MTLGRLRRGDPATLDRLALTVSERDLPAVELGLRLFPWNPRSGGQGDIGVLMRSLNHAGEVSIEVRFTAMLDACSIDALDRPLHHAIKRADMRYYPVGWVRLLMDLSACDESRAVATRWARSYWRWPPTINPQEAAR